MNHRPTKSNPWMAPAFLLIVAPRVAADGGTFDYQFESYNEEDGRVDVESHYFDIRQQFETGTALGIRYVMDSISGATPVGTYDPNNPDQWNFAEVEDDRDAVSLLVDQKIGDHLLTFEYSRSEEIDYLSHSFALSGKSELFDKNTVISAGLAYANDTVIATPGTTIAADQDKDSWDLALGVSQILAKNTVVDFNFTYGHSEGYLSDPYRQISETRTVLVPIPGGGTVPVETHSTHPENRPDSRDRLAFKVTGKHYFEAPDASMVGAYRIFSDGDGMVSHTFEIAWNQQITEKFIVSPFVRFYDQSAADYYYPSLTGTGVTGHGRSDGEPANYSSDYRVAALQSLTYGVGLDYQATDWLGLNFKLERYEMSGSSSKTPSIMFPTANVISVGLSATY